jgi:serine phosphatase RsbU (regulator of sigma subunit)/CHASE3 domain sensor protein
MPSGTASMPERPAGDGARATSQPERPAGSITAGVVLAVAVLISIVGSVVTYNSVHQAFAQQNQLQQAAGWLQTLQRQQLEEDTALRGFISTGEPVFVESYDAAQPEYRKTLDELESFVTTQTVSEALQPLLDLRHKHEEWVTRVAQPLINSPHARDTLDAMKLDKLLMTESDQLYTKLSTIFEDRAQHTVNESFTLLLRAAVITAALILLFGVAAIVADAYRGRTQAALARERAVSDTLQRAFLSGWDLLPHLRIGTAYVSSTRETTVGGDLFDVHRLDDHRSMLLVADVSGKGLTAAVQTALVKYSIRTLAETQADPGAVLARFNQTFLRSAEDAGAFVSVFLGILDDRDLSLRYASAGHGTVFLRTGNRVATLPPTGPLIGLQEGERFDVGAVELNVGDILVLATDGLTEARDQAGVMLGDELAVRWIERGNPDPQHLADEMVARLKRYSGGRLTDDLALLVIRVQRAPAAGAATPESVERHDVAPTRADGLA